MTTPDSIYSFGDSIPVHINTYDKFGSTVKIECCTSGSNVFSTITGSDIFVIAPDSANPRYAIKVRITDDDSGIVIDSTIVSVNMFKQATLSAPFAGRNGHSTVVFDNKLCVIGGWELNGISKNDVWYSADGINWKLATEHAGFSARSNHSAVVYNNKIWIIGGDSTSSGYPIAKNDVWFSSDGITWTQATAAAAFSIRTGHTSLVFDNKMWVIGGFATQGTYDFNNTKNDIWFSSDGISWTQATDSASFSPRYGHSSIVYDNKMWVIGGSAKTEGKTGFTNDVWYSSDGITWKLATNNASFSPRFDHSSTVYDNKMWVIGGGAHDNSSESGINKDVWSSSDGISWTLISKSPGFIARENHTVAEFNNRLYVIGGLNVRGSQKDVWYTSLRSK